MCSTCQTNPAKSLCFCDYPLTAFCSGQCMEKHRSLPGFHFEMPISQSPSVTRENFSAYQTWVFGLSRAQQALRKNLSTIQSFEGELEAAFGHIEKEIAALKGEYKEAIARLKQTIAAMIEPAIGETTAQALSPDPQFAFPLSGWIWEKADPSTPGNLQLYHMTIKIGDKGDILKLISAEFERNSSVLPEFPFKTTEISNANLTTYRPISNRLLNSSLPRASVDDTAELSLRSKHSRSLNPLISQESVPYKRFAPSLSAQITPKSSSSTCKTCTYASSAKSQISRCPNSCECRVCLAESILAPNSKQQCPYCSLPYSQAISTPILEEYVRCHVCGLVVRKTKLDPEIPCHPCQSCVVIYSETSFWLFSSQVRTCPECESTPRGMQEAGKGRSGEELSACCERSLDGGSGLECGHFVCKAHSGSLKRCRACHKEVSRS